MPICKAKASCSQHAQRGNKTHRFQGPTNLLTNAIMKQREIWLLPIYLLVSHKTKSPAVHRKRNWIRFNKSKRKEVGVKNYVWNILECLFFSLKIETRTSFGAWTLRIFAIAQIVERINLDSLARPEKSSQICIRSLSITHPTLNWVS